MSPRKPKHSLGYYAAVITGWVTAVPLILLGILGFFVAPLDAVSIVAIGLLVVLALFAIGIGRLIGRFLDRISARSVSSSSAETEGSASSAEPIGHSEVAARKLESRNSMSLRSPGQEDRRALPISQAARQSADALESARIYVRWHKNGKEYGPYTFMDIVVRRWSGPPAHGRFEGEMRWRNFREFLDIVDRLAPTEEQKCFLAHKNVELDRGASFKEAAILVRKFQDQETGEVEEIEDRLRKLRKAKKDALPATKYTRSKLQELGIDYPESITRLEARQLIAMDGLKEELRSYENFFRKRSISLEIPDFFGSEQPFCAKKQAADSALADLEQFVYFLEDLDKLGVKPSLPSKLDLSVIKGYSDKCLSAFNAAEDAEFEITEREIFTPNGDSYRIVGKIDEQELVNLKGAVLRKALRGTWDSERDLRSTIKKHMPSLKMQLALG
jgi:hypothetical protein